jgi:hypothetical protein
MLKDQITHLKHESKADNHIQVLQKEIEKLNLDVTRIQMLYDIRGKGMQQLHKQVMYFSISLVTISKMQEDQQVYESQIKQLEVTIRNSHELYKNYNLRYQVSSILLKL